VGRKTLTQSINYLYSRYLAPVPGQRPVIYNTCQKAVIQVKGPQGAGHTGHDAPLSTMNG